MATLCRKQVRERQGVIYNPQRTSALAEAAIWEMALVKNQLPGLGPGHKDPALFLFGLVVG